MVLRVVDTLLAGYVGIAASMETWGCPSHACVESKIHAEALISSLEPQKHTFCAFFASSAMARNDCIVSWSNPKMYELGNLNFRLSSLNTRAINPEAAFY